MPAQTHEYKAVIYREPLLGSIFLGASRIDPRKFTNFLNENAKDGWDVVTMEKDVRRELIFFRREGYVVILKREVNS